MHHIAFALDPDSYWVEIIAQNAVDKSEGVTETDLSTYRMNRKPSYAPVILTRSSLTMSRVLP